MGKGNKKSIKTLVKNVKSQKIVFRFYAIAKLTAKNPMETLSQTKK